MNCQLCSQPFTISATEEAFLTQAAPTIKNKAFTLATPKFCPRCRIIRRCAFRNERRLYQRKCDLSGKEIISIYSQDKPFKVYDQKEWWSDKWDAIDYGQDYDFNRPFFDQFSELMSKVPRLSMMSANNENSDYTNCVSHLKNCYLVFSSDYNQDCYYSAWLEASKDCMDTMQVDQSELVYYSFFSQNCHNGNFLINCSECHDSSFLFDCKGSSNCFMSSGLRNKQYYFGNKPYTRKEYEAKIKEVDLGSATQLQALKAQFMNQITTTPRLFMYRTGRVQNSSGNLLTDTEKCIECFDTLRGQDCMYTQGALDIKSSQHSSFVMGELSYENIECVPAPNHSGFNMNSYSGSNLWYTDTCMNNCQNCFGCIGLKHKEYCILNKQYTKHAYEELVPKIIAHMQSTGEWGEFFPITSSPFAYNETTAYDYFPFIQESVIDKLKGKWKEHITQSRYHGQERKPPDHIKDCGEITKVILTCNQCQKQYRIIQQELAFYQKQNLAIPTACFDCRHRERLSWKNGWLLWDRNCVKCQAPIKTAYSSERKEILYCEVCYLETVY